MSGAFVLRAGRYRIAVLVALAAAVFGAASPARAIPPVSMSVVVPLVSATVATGSIGVDELESNTAPGGAWTILANAAIDNGATIALDSRITASIERLGDDAPASAVAWLATVQRSNPLDLPWGNADPFLLAQPTTNYRVSTIQLSELSGVAASDFVAWPTGRVGGANSLDRLRALGFAALIADDGTFPTARGTISADAGALVAEAISPESTTSMSGVVDQLLSGGLPHALALPRTLADVDAARAMQFLDELGARGITLTRYVPVPVDELANPVIHDVPKDAIATILFQHRFDGRAAAIGLDPAVIALPRLERICVLAGRVDDNRFSAYVRTNARFSHYLNDVVTIQQGATYTILSNQADIPLTVTNTSATDITIIVSVRSQTGSLHVTNPSQKLTVPANSNAQVTVPVDTVANGRTALVASLLTADGLDVSGPIVLPVDVQAQWEGVTLIGFVVVVGTILGIGITRQIRDRRRRA